MVAVVPFRVSGTKRILSVSRNSRAALSETPVRLAQLVPPLVLYSQLPLVVEAAVMAMPSLLLWAGMLSVSTSPMPVVVLAVAAPELTKAETRMPTLAVSFSDNEYPSFPRLTVAVAKVGASFARVTLTVAVPETTWVASAPAPSAS